MAVSRFGIASNRKTALMKQQMREIAKLLNEDPPKEEKARIRAEALIRDDNTVEAYEILQLTCELLSERIKLIASQKACPDDLKESIHTLIWCATRVDIPELLEIKKQFRYKYGKDFVDDASENKCNVVNERILSKLSVQPPTAFLVHTYLEKIADQFEVVWSPTVKLKAEDMAQPTKAPVGYSVQVAPGTGLAPSSPFMPNPNGNSISTSHNTTAMNHNNHDKQQISLPLPNLPVVPPPALSTSKPMPPSANYPSPIDTIEEPDIFVPSEAMKSSGPPTTNMQPDDIGKSTETQNVDITDDNESNEEDDAFAILQARFDELKNR
eukprot:CAMPEP_0184871248 /NCGR_PEP_ID=MMETSP0580-20130426/40502_1 /TAXON_ID=1118495 /ORGANISM="Dactyliosolen fragilissimus" /LENGTH=324 /DNA_ID=CAMNT_0027373865 /DNA_START=140 /DNA_END=1114 /DNA_ORIENTATION=-